MLLSLHKEQSFKSQYLSSILFVSISFLGNNSFCTLAMIVKVFLIISYSLN